MELVISKQAMPLSMMISILPGKNHGSKTNRHYGSQTTFTAQTQRNIQPENSRSAWPQAQPSRHETPQIILNFDTFKCHPS